MKEQILKIKEYIKKYDNIFFVGLIFVCTFGITLYIQLTSNDELWNFQNIYKMYNGFQIYKDANVIITPLFFWLGKLLFFIFGANFLTFRIYNILIFITLYFFMYLILKKLKFGKKISTIIILSLIILNKFSLIRSQANYTVLALAICFIGVYILLKKYKYTSIIQGIMIFLIFSTKQNVGIYYAIGLFLYEIFNDNNLKEKIKNIFIENVLFIFLLLLLFYYFFINNNLYYFINYAFLGISEFASKNILIEVSSLILTIFLVSINIILTIFFIKNKKVNDVEKKNLIILNCFSIPLTLIMLPILNGHHFLLGIYFSTILFLYIIKKFLKELKISINNKVVTIILIIMIIMIPTESTIRFINYFKFITNVELPDKFQAFYGSVYEDDIIKKIENVTKYIETNPRNVIILSHKAAFYMIPLKKNNGMFDLPLIGNLGKDGENGLIEEIKKLKNTEILIARDENDNCWQESLKVREYIINNMDKIGEIEEFDIYY